MKRIFLKTFMLLFLAIFFSCKHEMIGNDDEDYALIISYDQQQISYDNFANIKDTTLLTRTDLLNSQPIVKREEWKIKIRHDGSCRMEVTIKEPTISFGTIESIAKDVNAEYKKIIYDNDKAYFFDKNNKLLYSFDHEMPNYRSLLPLYAEKANKKYIVNPSKLKSDEVDINNIVITDYPFSDESMGNLIERTFYDTSRNVLVKSELYTSNYKLISKDTMSYTMFAPNHYVPIFEKHTSYDTNVYHQPYTRESSTDYLSIDIINNL